MKKKKRGGNYPFNGKQAFKLAVTTSILLNAVLLMGIFYGRSRSFIDEIEIALFAYIKFFVLNFASNLLLYYLILIYNNRIVKSRKIKSKTFCTLIGIIAIWAILSPILSQIQWLALGGIKGSLGQNGFIMFNLIKDIIAILILMVLINTVYLNYKREQILISNQKLQEENILARFEALKNKLNPHFLFNSLNTLNGLIGVDDRKAHDYVENLSAVFRYTLHSKNLSILYQEIEFVEAYVTLLRIRFGDNIKVNYKIDSKYQDYYIMPVSIQMLVENAVKHNVISNKSPLSIIIESTVNDSIIVSNKINPKNEKFVGGVGLANLTNRYSILFNKQITISNSGEMFSVEVPLIKEPQKTLIYESSNYRR